MGLEMFSATHDSEFRKMGAELRKANAEDKKALKKQGGGLIIATVNGKAKQIPNANYSNTMKGCMADMRNRFKGCTIRRTVWSIDNTGKRISGLEPFEEHPLLLKLYPSEMANLEAIAAESSSAAKVLSGKASSNFPDDLMCFS